MTPKRPDRCFPALLANSFIHMIRLHWKIYDGEMFVSVVPVEMSGRKELPLHTNVGCEVVACEVCPFVN